jgi:hypothetical protein
LKRKVKHTHKLCLLVHIPAGSLHIVILLSIHSTHHRHVLCTPMCTHTLARVHVQTHLSTRLAPTASHAHTFLTWTPTGLPSDAHPQPPCPDIGAAAADDDDWDEDDVDDEPDSTVPKWKRDKIAREEVGVMKPHFFHSRVAWCHSGVAFSCSFLWCWFVHFFCCFCALSVALERGGEGEG